MELDKVSLWVIKLMRLSWAGHVEVRNAFKITATLQERGLGIDARTVLE
jgi:hypothetical protein